MNLTLPRAQRPRAARHERQGEQTRARHRPDRGAELRPEPGARGHRRERRAPEPIRDPIPPRGARREPRDARASPVPPAAHLPAVVADGGHARYPHQDDAPREPRVHLQPLRLLRRPPLVPRRDLLHALPGGRPTPRLATAAPPAGSSSASRSSTSSYPGSGTSRAAGTSRTSPTDPRPTTGSRSTPTSSPRVSARPACRAGSRGR